MEADDENQIYSTNAYQLQIVVTSVTWNMAITNIAAPRKGSVSISSKNHLGESAGRWMEPMEIIGVLRREVLLVWGRREGAELEGGVKRVQNEPGRI